MFRTVGGGNDAPSSLARVLCDLGLGESELGYVSFAELEIVRGPLWLPIDHDLHFAPARTVAVYAYLAREHRSIIT